MLKMCDEVFVELRMCFCVIERDNVNDNLLVRHDICHTTRYCLRYDMVYVEYDVLKYSYVLKIAKENIIAHLEWDEDENFLYYFVILGSSVKCFKQYIRLMIVVDDIHLKGLYQEGMFVATCLDENNYLYRLPIRVLDSKNNDV